MPQNRRLGNHRTSGLCVGDVGGREDDIGRVDRRRSGLELARHILDIPRVERAW
jgi:hypothetical protein